MFEDAVYVCIFYRLVTYSMYSISFIFDFTDTCDNNGFSFSSGYVYNYLSIKFGYSSL